MLLGAAFNYLLLLRGCKEGEELSRVLLKNCVSWNISFIVWKLKARKNPYSFLQYLLQGIKLYVLQLFFVHSNVFTLETRDILYLSIAFQTVSVSLCRLGKECWEVRGKEVEEGFCRWNKAFSCSIGKCWVWIYFLACFCKLLSWLFSLHQPRPAETPLYF